MERIENIRHYLSSEQRVLDIQQLRMIGLYEQLVYHENIFEYLKLLNHNGYMMWFEFENEKFRFIGCDPKYIGFNGNQNIHEQFEWNLILMVKQMLTDWHNKKRYHIKLTKKERGVLTKILKIENKRKRLLVGDTN